MPTQAHPQSFARFLDGVSTGLSAVGFREPSLEPAALVERAAASSGCAPPPEGRYLAPLQAITDAARESTTLSGLGRRMFATALTLRLHNHFQIADWLARHPEILDEPIERPVFIVSLPRTGTTMLHRLLSVHPEHRVLYTWEMDRPVPQPRSALAPSRSFASAVSIQMLHWMCPDLKRIHDVQAGYPEECINLLANELTSMIFTLFYDLPGYLDYLHQVDMEPVYRSHRRQLQLLQAGRPRRRWVLKAPFHLLGLGALLRVYPDALIVQTHRDPAELVASEASLQLSIRRSFQTSTDLHRLGQERLEELGLWIDRGMAAREEHGDAAFIDVPYLEMVRDPLSWVEQIAARLDEPLSEETRAAMVAHMSIHRQRRHGKHRYSLERFGLEPGAVQERFAAYNKRFRISSPQ